MTTPRPLLGSCACVALMLASPPALAQPVARLTVAEAIALGNEASHRLGELDARQAASEAAVRSAHAGRLPQLSLQGGYTRTNHVDEFKVLQPGAGFEVVYPDLPDNARTRLDLQWQLYSGGRVESLTGAAKFDAEASRDDLDAARVDLRLDIARAYWALVNARESVRVVGLSLTRVAAYLKDARARFDAGFVPPSDVLQAEAQQSLQRALLVEAQNGVQLATLALGRLVGLAPDTVIEPVEPLETPAADRPDAATLVAEARRTREDRKAIEARIAGTSARGEAAAAGGKPSVFASGGIDYSRPNTRFFPRTGEWNDSWDVGVSAVWTFFDGGRVRADVAVADANARALRERLADFDTVLELEVRQRLFDVSSNRARAAAASDAVRSAEEARRVLQDRYNAGVATSTEVLDSQSVLLQAELDRTRSLSAVRLAEAGLDRAIGR